MADVSNLEKLLKQYCPNGVEYKPMGRVVIIDNGYAFPSKSLHETGKYGVVKTTNINNGRIDCTKMQYINEPVFGYEILPGTIVLGLSGTIKAGRNQTDQTFYLNQRVARFIPSDLIDESYLYYVISHCVDDFAALAGGNTVKNLSTVDLKKFSIPVPPIPVQQEIVRILDKFTELEAELEAELQLRKKQYEWYRDQLLTFRRDGSTDVLPWLQRLLDQYAPNGVGWKPLKEVFTRLRGTPITAGKMKEIENPDGDIRIFAGGKTVINAFEADIPNANITRVPAVLVQSRGVIDFVYYDKPFTFKNEMWAYTCDEQVSLRYLWYVLKNDIPHFRKAAEGMGSLPQISLPVTEDYVIPVPPIQIQEAIVAALDNFSTLVTDISSGLPAEIAARQKQYEYYRDKLLSFEMKGNV